MHTPMTDAVSFQSRWSSLKPSTSAADISVYSGPAFAGRPV